MARFSRLQRRETKPAVSDIASAHLVGEPTAHRPVYPYSVISGGVSNAAELRIALYHDPVAAAHYADFDPAHVQVVRLAQARRAYVSFRKDNRIYWTRRPILLAKGETVLSDGVNEARTRCGNRISDTPRTPVLETDQAAKWESRVDWDTPSLDRDVVPDASGRQPLIGGDVFSGPNLVGLATSSNASGDSFPLQPMWLPANVLSGLPAGTAPTLTGSSSTPPTTPGQPSSPPVGFSAPSVPPPTLVLNVVTPPVIGPQLIFLPGPAPIPSPTVLPSTVSFTPPSPPVVLFGPFTPSTPSGPSGPSGPSVPSEPQSPPATITTLTLQPGPPPGNPGPSPVPEPSTIFLAGAGVVVALLLRR